MARQDHSDGGIGMVFAIGNRRRPGPLPSGPGGGQGGGGPAPMLVRASGRLLDMCFPTKATPSKDTQRGFKQLPSSYGVHNVLVTLSPARPFMIA
jgi:hypothetical protein